MLNKVTATNFQSWSELEFEIEKGIKIVDGWNNDDQTSEGSGKSATLNAISWGAYGQIPKDAKIDEVIKDGESSCKVVLHFSNGDAIVRTRKPNDLYILKSGGAVVKGKDAKETQEFIEEYVGMNFDTFCQSVYFAQNYDKKFLPGNPEMKGKILANIQNTSVFDKARKEVMELAKHEEKKVTTLRNNLQIEDNNLRNIETQADMLKSFVQQKIDAHVEQVRALREKRDGYAALVEIGRSNVAKAQAAVDAVDLSSIETDEQELNAVRPQFATQLADVKYRKSQIDSIKKAILGKESEGQILAKKYNDLSERLRKHDIMTNPRVVMLNNQRDNLSKSPSKARLLSKVEQLEAFIANPTKTCPSCGSELKSLDTSHTDKELAAVRQEIADLDARVIEDRKNIDAQIQAEVENLDKQRETMQQDCATIMEQLGGISEYLQANPLPSLQELEAEESEVSKTITSIDAALRDTQSKKIQRTQLESELKLQTQRCQQNEQLYTQVDAEMSKIQDPDLTKELAQQDALNKQRSETTEKRSHVQGVLDQALVYQGRLETLKEGFKEIKSYVFSKALQELNMRANEYLSELFEVPATIKFTTEDQKIESKVILNGQERGLGLLSGGQNRRFNLAVDLALSDLVSNRKSSKLDLLILDEYFKDLSEVSMEKCLDLLKTRKCPVVLIEHNSIFKNIVDNTFFVRLENGTSYESRA